MREPLMQGYFFMKFSDAELKVTTWLSCKFNEAQSEIFCLKENRFPQIVELFRAIILIIAAMP